MQFITLKSNVKMYSLLKRITYRNIKYNIICSSYVPPGTYATYRLARFHVVSQQKVKIRRSVCLHSHL